MNYSQMFARLVGLCLAAGASADLLAFVTQISRAAIWNDDDALRVIADATEEINQRIEDDGEVWEIRRECYLLQSLALAELRGEILGEVDASSPVTIAEMLIGYTPRAEG